MLPFEFTVPGPPLSHQAKNKARLAQWRQAVRSAAALAWPSGDPPLAVPLKITVVYYHEGPSIRLDGDNMLKPIQDAMNGSIYVDDRLIVVASTTKTPVDGSYRVRWMSQVLADAWVRGEEFVYVKIEAAPTEELLP